MRSVIALGRLPRRPSIDARRLVRVAALLAAASLAACSASPQPTFDLSAPGGTGARGGGGVAGAQLVVAEPTSIQPLEADRIMARDAAGSVSYIGGAQWADRLPRLIQTRLIQTFENTSRMRGVSRPGEGVTADYQLNTEIRAFQLDAARGEAFVSLSVKLLNAKESRIVNARVFTARVPVPSSSGPVVAQALDVAMQNVLLDIVRWAGPRR